MADKVITDSEVIEQIRSALPVSTETEKGLLNAGCYITEIKRYINPDDSIDIGKFNGFVFIKNGYAWGGQAVYWISYDKSILIAGPGYSIGISFDVTDNDVTIHFNGSNRIGLSVVLLHIPKRDL